MILFFLEISGHEGRQIIQQGRNFSICHPRHQHLKEFRPGKRSDEILQGLLICLPVETKTDIIGVLVPRMTDAEISTLLDDLSSLMARHFKEKEYHALFLGRK